MKKHMRKISGFLLVAIILIGAVVPVTAGNKIVTTATGYTSASDVKYQYHTSKNYISNWGARGEDCTFLSSKAQEYYVNNYAYGVLSSNQGGTSQSSAPSSALYRALKSMMEAEHSYIISYDATRDLYKYTDCLLNDTAHISSFYSGKQLNGAWDSAATWNREHTWPKSKSLDKNNKNNDNGDIMMLRPTWVQENSSRGNTAYGEGSSYYDPGESTRGDCARIVLYVYVRWGNTSKMWGTSGVMENLDVLLRWMEEDPVDTWEMGRNDAVESITGVRNVFVDYPEYAWLLFGEDIPNDMSTPSGIARDGSGNTNTGNSNTGNTNTGNTNTGNTNTGNTNTGNTNTGNANTGNSNTGNTNTGNTNTGNNNTNNSTDTNTGNTECTHTNTEMVNVKDATCVENGYDGDIICKDCGAVVQLGQVIAAPGSHAYGDWVVLEEATDTTDGSKERICSRCEYKETETIPALNKAKEPANPWVVGTAIVVPSGCALGAIITVVLKKMGKRQ